MSREGFYWHLRDKSRSWVERTKLLRYAWKHDTVLLPNKYQTLLDLLIFGLNDRKRWPVSDVKALWTCLREVLQTPQCQSGKQATHTLVLKSTVLQIFQDELSQALEYTKIHDTYPEISDIIISCCVFALTSPTLGSVFAGKHDVLVSHLSLALSLANVLTNKNLAFPDRLPWLLTALVARSQQAIRQRAQPQQTVGSVTNKLLAPALQFIYGKREMDETKHELMEILRTVLFHRELLPQYELYLKLRSPQSEPKSPKSGSSKLPKFIENIFNRLQESVNSSCAETQHCVLEYLPEFYSGFVANYRDKSTGSSLQLLKLLLVDLLDLPITAHVNETATALPLTSDGVQGHLKVVVDLVAVLQKHEVYDLGKDDSGEQLKWFKSLASWILSLETRSCQWYGALDSLLQLDHAIVEPKLTAVLTKTLVTNQDPTACEQRDVLLNHLLDLFVRLRQMSKFMSRLIRVIRESGDGEKIQLPKQFVKMLMVAVGQMPITLVYEVWEMFAAQITADDLHPSICRLFAQFLLHIELTDHNMSRITDLSHDLWQGQLLQALEASSKEGGTNLLEVLNLVHSFGELQILLRYYHPLYTQSPRHGQFFNLGQLPQNPQLKAGLVYTYAEVSTKIWKECRKQSENDGQIDVVWMKLEIQQLKALMLFEEVEKQANLLVAMETMRSSLYDTLLRRKEDRPVYDQMSRVLINHMCLLTNQAADSMSHDQLYPIIVQELKKKKCLGGNMHVQEDPKYHRVVLRNVQKQIDGVRSGLESVEESPRKKRKRVTTEMDQSSADILSRLVQPGTSDGCELKETEATNLLKALQEQSCLPLEYLSTDNTEICMANVMKVFHLLWNLPAVTGVNRLELVETCYRHLAVVLAIFLQHQDGDCANILSFMMEFHGKLSHWNTHVSHLYQTIMTSALKPLLKSREGLMKLRPFLDQVKQACDLEEKVNQKKHAALVTMETVIRCLAKNTRKQHLHSEVIALSEEYLDLLSQVLFKLVHQLLTKTTMKPERCCLVGGFGVLVIQACKSETMKVKITEMISPLYEFCLQQFTRNKEASLVKACADFVYILCQNYATLHPYLPATFVQKTWDSLTAVATYFGPSQSLRHCCENYTKQCTRNKDNRVELSTEKTAKNLPKSPLLKKKSRNGQGTEVTMETDGLDETSGEGEDLVAVATSIERSLLGVVAIADDAAFSGILEGLVEQLDVGRDPRAALTSLRLFSSLVSCELRQSQWARLALLIQKLVIRLQSLLVSTGQRSDVSVPLTEATLSVHSSFLAQGPVLLSPQSVAACLHSCIHTPLQQKDLPLCCYTALHKAVYSVLNEMLVHHPKVVSQCVPAYLSVVRGFVSSLIMRGDQGEEPRSEREEQQLISAGHLVDRLLTLISSHKEDFGRVAAYIISDYVNEVQKVTLLPELKKVILPGVYHILGLCDHHAIAQLYTVLSPGVKDIFRTLHQEYTKYFKYTGKV